MKILCVSDHVDPLVYSSGVKSRFSDIDLVLSAGDLPMEYLGFISSSLNKRIYFVFGNHHLKHLELFTKQTDSNQEFHRDERLFRNYFGSTCIDGKARRHGSLLIAGLGGSRRYNSGDHQFTDFQMRLRIMKLIPRLLWNRLAHGRYIDILLTHAAPLDLNDRPDPTHVGFPSFVRFIERFHPKYLLHGHIHLYDINAVRETEYAGTKIINVYDHLVLEFSPDRR